MSIVGSALASIGRTFAGVVTPFTPATYDSVFGSRLPGLPQVTYESMLALPAAYACTVVISEDIAKVPLQMFEMSSQGKSLARDHPIYDLIHHQANDELTALEFREWMTAIAVNRGAAYAEITRGQRSRADQLVPLHPDYIRKEQTDDGRLRIRYQDPIRKRERVIVREDLFVLRGRFGVGVVHYARQNFELLLAMQRSAAEFYGRGLRSPGYLHTKDTLQPTTKKDLREALDEYMTGGERAGRPMLLDAGMEWKSIALSLEDAEFLGTLQHGIGDVCRWYRVPKHKVMELMPGTHASLAVQGVDYVVDSLLGWSVRWEQAIRRDLILRPERFMAEHNLEGLLRGDTKSRYEAYKIAVTFGWMTRAEVRERENLNPIPGAGLEEPILPLNMAGQVASGTAGGALGALSDPSVVSYLRVLVRDGAARIVRKESAHLSKLAERGDDWERGVRDFYRAHAEYTAKVLHVPEEVAAAYADDRMRALIQAGPQALDDSDSETIADLTDLALNASKPLQLPMGEAA